MERPLCSKCHKNLVEKSGNKGSTKFRKLCNTCRRPDLKKGSYDRRLSQKHRNSNPLICTICGFIPVDICQLDVHHIDGNHKNRKKENLQIVCANCHRLMTKQQKEMKKLSLLLSV